MRRFGVERWLIRCVIVLVVCTACVLFIRATTDWSKNVHDAYGNNSPPSLELKQPQSSELIEVPGKFEWIAVEPELENMNATTMTEAQLEKAVFRYMKRLQIKCPRQIRMGRKEDGGWDVCTATPFEITKPCLAYSIGMGGEWSFDHMITSKQYGCQDFAYDPTLGKPNHTPRPLLYFYNVGLGGSDGVNKQKWRLKTFPTLLQENHHVETTIDILKMDIEYSEWDSLEAILAKPSCLKNVKQLMIEYHTREMNKGKTSSVEDLQRYWRLTRGLNELGFKAWNVWNNHHCNFNSTRSPGTILCGCFNTYYINTQYIHV